jgi:hypothetical protein
MKPHIEYVKKLEFLTEMSDKTEQMIDGLYRIVEQNQKLSQQKRAFIIGMFAVNLIFDLAGIKKDGVIRKAFSREMFIRVGLQMIAQVRRTDPHNQL